MLYQYLSTLSTNSTSQNIMSPMFPEKDDNILFMLTQEKIIITRSRSQVGMTSLTSSVHDDRHDGLGVKVIGGIGCGANKILVSTSFVTIDSEIHRALRASNCQLSNQSIDQSMSQSIKSIKSIDQSMQIAYMVLYQ